MTQTRMYLVTSDFGTNHLVEATSQAAAIRAVVGKKFVATVPSAKEVMQLMRQGIDVITEPDDNHALDSND